MSPEPEEGTPFVFRRDGEIIVQPKIIVNVQPPVVHLTVESIPVTTNVTVQAATARRDLILAIIAVILAVGLFV